MKKTTACIFLVFVAINFLAAQEKPTDTMNQLPDFFPEICSAKNNEVQGYAKELGAFTENVHKNFELLSDLKTKAQNTVKANPNANVKALQQEFEKAKKSLSISKDFKAEFDKVLHNEAEIRMNVEMEENLKQQQQTSDWQKMEQLGNQLVKIKADYCNATSRRYIELLVEQRAMLKVNLNQMVIVSDLNQKINCKLFGYTYIPELSYEEAYIFILDHLEKMHQLLYLAPGNE